jgi:uncharacterized protein (TIGR02466 family)
MEKINLFAIPVIKVKLTPTDFQFNALDALINKLLAESTENAWALEDGKSTGEKDLYLYKHIQAKWLVDGALEHVRALWQTMDYRRGAEIVPTSSWANLHQYGQATGEHSHCGGAMKSHISVVYYLKKPPGSGNIMFTDPLEYIHKMTPAHVYDETLNSMYTEINAEQFDLVIFPSWLKHHTQANMTQEDRVAISINYIGLWR